MKLELSCSQQLLLTASFQQALHILQLPIEELAEWMEEESLRNPLIEVREKKKRIAEAVQEEAWQESVYEKLLRQLPLIFKNDALTCAKEMIGHLDEKGFLEGHFDEEIRQKLFHLDPLGIGCRDVREYVLLQLEEKGQKSDWIYRIVEHHFYDLLQEKWKEVAALEGVSIRSLELQVKTALRGLRWYPLDAPKQVCPQLVPDLIFLYEADQWKIAINTSALPQVTLKSYKGIDYKYLREKKRAAHFLIQACEQRRRTLLKIGKRLLVKQKVFFEGTGRGQLVPMTCREVAEEIGLHESTVSRAIASKYLSCPFGIFPLERFFKQGVEGVSNDSVQQMLKSLVDKEDSRFPLSDGQLLEELQRRGVHCARRTIAKYRGQLRIPAFSRRRI
ncbi:MAG: hypothetical protein RLZZ453_763 [Chlamydiota bacterium]|jgi:RNA polymerase sigma-54 factor